MSNSTDKALLTRAAALWREAAARERRWGQWPVGERCAQIYENTALELEHERDTGEIIHINPRTKPKYGAY